MRYLNLLLLALCATLVMFLVGCNTPTTPSATTSTPTAMNSTKETPKKEGRKATPQMHEINWLQIASNGSVVRAGGGSLEDLERNSRPKIYDKLWNLADRSSGELRDGMSSCTFSPNGKMIAYADDQFVRLRRIKRASFGQTVWQTPLKEAYPQAVTPDGKTLVVTREVRLGKEKVEQWVNLLDMATGKTRLTFRDWFDDSGYYAVSPDSKLLAIGNHSGTIKVRRLADGREMATFKRQGGENAVDFIMALAFENQDLLVARDLANPFIERCDLNTSERRQLQLPDAPKRSTDDWGGGSRTGVFSLDGRIFVLGDGDGKLLAFDTKNGHRLWQYQGQEQRITLPGGGVMNTLLHYATAERLLAVGDISGSVALHDWRTGKIRQTLK